MCRCYLLAFALLLIVERSVLVISQVTNLLVSHFHNTCHFNFTLLSGCVTLCVYPFVMNTALYSAERAINSIERFQ